MKNILHILILLTTALSSLQAQQENHYTQFMYNKLLINPAYAGIRSVPTITAIYRNQWLGFDGAPKSVLASFSSPFITKRVGVGVTIDQRQIGIDNDFNGSLAYAYKLIATDKVCFQAGIMGSIRSHSIHFDKATPISSGDPSLDNKKVNAIYGNLGLGLYAVFEERYYAGFSVPHMYSNNLGININPLIETAKEAPHYYGMAGGIFPLSEDLNLMSAVLLKYVKNVPFDADINVNIEIRKKVTAGLSYRIGGDGPGESIDLLAYWQVTPQFGIGAAYDLTMSGLRNYSAGSFEMLAQYDLKKQMKRKMSNPRFFL